MNLYDYSVAFHKLAERKSPGSDEQSKKALNYLPFLNDEANILDIGCASGMQTILLAENTSAHITAIDIVPDFLEELKLKVKKLKLEKRVTVRLQSMDKLDYPDETFDLLWVENSIYHIGFDRGIKEWRRYLKPDGHIVIADMAWLTDGERPTELVEFIYNISRDVDTVINKIGALRKNGYELVKFFIIPEQCWLEEYYLVLKSKINSFLIKHAMNKLAVMYTNEILHEIEMYKKYSDYFGIVFYIVRLPSNP